MARAVIIVCIVIGLFGLNQLVQSPTPVVMPNGQQFVAAQAGNKFIINPYLQFPTRNSITVNFELEKGASARVEYGEKEPMEDKVESKDASDGFHSVVIRGLKPNSHYVYRVVTDGLTSPNYTFRTAVDPTDSFSFGLIGDTQANPKVTEQIADQLFRHRPHFVLHGGDVVDNGPVKREWIQELFGPCSKLFSHVPVFPTIGNHEKNHEHYYKYFALPAPKYYYNFRYANAEFFAIDSNKNLKPGSEQYAWLDKALGQSNALWKIVFHHHPAWSSDNDDYGNTLKGPSRLGDVNVRSIVPLLEKHGVELDYNGHIHLYERSWPIRMNQVNRQTGIVYLTSGGGGGKLDDVSTQPNWFKCQTRVDFHYCYITISGNLLEAKAYDRNGNLFDSFDIRR